MMATTARIDGHNTIDITNLDTPTALIGILSLDDHRYPAPIKPLTRRCASTSYLNPGRGKHILVRSNKGLVDGITATFCAACGAFTNVHTITLSP